MGEGNFGGEKFESAGDLLRKEVQNHREYIDKEFERGVGNTWPNCVLSRLTAMTAFLDMAGEDGDISEEDSEELQAKLKRAIAHAREMQRRYTTVDAVIPRREKEEMLTMLDIFNS